MQPRAFRVDAIDNAMIIHDICHIMVLYRCRFNGGRQWMLYTSLREVLQ